MPHRGVPAGITACLTRECLRASTRVNGFNLVKTLKGKDFVRRYGETSVNRYHVCVSPNPSFSAAVHVGYRPIIVIQVDFPLSQHLLFSYFSPLYDPVWHGELYSFLF